MVKRARGALLLSLELDRASSQHLSVQLYAGLREIILAGGLMAGDRLPASRALALDLGVSRTTVSEAYERLVSEELIESRVGAGSFVSEALKSARPVKDEAKKRSGKAPSVKPARLSSSIAKASDQFRQRLPHEPRAFTTALPAFDAFPVAQWARQNAKHWRGGRNAVFGYGDPLGYMPLRRAIASHLKANRGISCDPRQIFIVGGAQQAFHLIASVLLNPGDTVWFENPGAIGARNSLVAVGANLVALPIDKYGMQVEVGLRKAPDFRLTFVTPAHQQPLGATMSLERRFALLQAAESADAIIIEDDWDGELRYAGRPMHTLKSVDRSGRVIYVGTFSKTMFPALRLGYFLAPDHLFDTFERVASAFLHEVPSNLQAVVAAFMEEGHFASHIRRMRKIYAERFHVLQDAAGKKLRGLLDIVPADTGLHTVGLLADGFREDEVSAAADARKITVAPINRFCMEPIATKGLVLGFSGIKPQEIVAGIDTLAQVLEDLDAGSPRREPRLAGRAIAASPSTQFLA